MISVRMCNNRKLHSCEKCGLEFTSGNSVLRHQEKSCLRVRVINLKTSGAKDGAVKKKCPICSSIFFNTHRLSIHIYKHHKNLLGSARQPPSADARRLNELQLKKIKSTADVKQKEHHFELDTSHETKIDDSSEDFLISSPSTNSSGSNKRRKTKTEQEQKVSSVKRLKSSDSLNNSTLNCDYTIDPVNLSVAGPLESTNEINAKLNMTF